MKATRRTFLISSAGMAAGLALHHQATAAEHVDENSPLAKQMHYTNDASKLTTAAEPKFKPGDACYKCQLYQGKDGDQWGPCPIFSGQDVHHDGWCTAFTPKS